ncbi:MAG TPA: hypothetical protein VFG43_16495 [Geminicoccaceae bacterium]|nr:hypothetical protein [Geminicoccaceae bacterium]
MRRTILAATAAAAVVAMISGCALPAKVTGGGTLPGKVAGKANLGFNGESCSGSVVGQFTYADTKSGVKMNGDVVEAVECLDYEDQSTDVAPAFCAATCLPAVGLPAYGFEVNYRSTNPKQPGSGQAIACVVDNGQGVKATSADEVVLVVVTGPFAGYLNQGPIKGNIKSHGCDG